MMNQRRAGGPPLASTIAFKALVALLAIALSLQFLLISWRHETDVSNESSLRSLLRRTKNARSSNGRGGVVGPDVASDAVISGGKSKAGPIGGAEKDSSAIAGSIGGAEKEPATIARPVGGVEKEPAVVVGPIGGAEKESAPHQPAHLFPHLAPLPPFAEIPNADDLAAETLAGRPTIAGIAAVLNRFLLAMHVSNKKLGAEQLEVNELRDKVLSAFTNLATEHLLAFDAVYRGRPIFPIREDDSVFISLASFRDHLLGETLREAFGRAADPDRLFVGAIVQNCFGVEYTCKTGAQVVGKNKQGRDMTKVSDAPPDVNGVAEFCEDMQYKKYCDAGQVRALYVNETESLGPAMARYYASKLWGGETFFVQVDAHLKFAQDWDAKYIAEVRAARSYPKAVLSSYPPGFEGFHNEGSPGARLCFCEFSATDVEDQIIRINTGARYPREGVARPKQVAFIAAGFFFTRAEFLTDIPFDPFLPWCFMGEEIALSMRAWTNGWDIYAPRLNLIAHQYRPGRMGLPKFWGSVGRVFGRPGPGFSNRLQSVLIQRIKHMVGYPELTREVIEEKGDAFVLTDIEHYSLGKTRSRAAYFELTKIDVEAKKCHAMQWCNRGELE